jgi:hypothetical protein
VIVPVVLTIVPVRMGVGVLMMVRMGMSVRMFVSMHYPAMGVFVCVGMGMRMFVIVRMFMGMTVAHGASSFLLFDAN